MARPNCFRFSARAAVRLPCSRYAGRSRKTCGSAASIASRSCWARILKQTRRFQRAPRIGVRRRRRAMAREPRYLGVARRWPADLFPGRQRIEDALLRAGQGTAASRNTGLRLAVALDFEAADEMVTGSLCWTSTLTVTSWSRSAFIRPMTDCP